MMSGDLFAGFIELLGEFTGEICARIIGGLDGPANLAGRPVERRRFVSDVVSGTMLIIDFLLYFAVCKDGALLRHLVGGIVVEFQFLACASILNDGLLCE